MFAPCPNLAHAADWFFQRLERCKETCRLTYCAIAGCSGSCDQRDTRVADAVDVIDDHAPSLLSPWFPDKAPQPNSTCADMQNAGRPQSNGAHLVVNLQHRRQARRQSTVCLCRDVRAKPLMSLSALLWAISNGVACLLVSSCEPEGSGPADRVIARVIGLAAEYAAKMAGGVAVPHDDGAETGSHVRPKRQRRTAVEYFAGLDVAMEETAICVIDREGKVALETTATTDPDAIVKLLKP
jgi:hypothetical protein